MEQPAKTVQDRVQDTFENIKENIPEIDTQKLSNNVNEGIQNVSNTINATTDSVKNTINDFSSQSTVNAGQEFLNSNSIIAKFAFVILVLIAFLILVNLGIKLIFYFTQAPKSPYLINGIVSGNSNVNIPQNPKNPDSITILRSNNQYKGIEATWSTWLLINDLNGAKPNSINNPPSFSHIFNKGNDTFFTNTTNTNQNVGIATVNNAPGVYISDGSQNVIRVYYDTVEDNNSYVEVKNIPLKKWFHLAIRIQNNIMDIYINGIISERKKFNAVPKQNYDDVHICYNNGFNGQLSNLVYYDYALGIFEINNIILRGPNTTLSSTANNSVGFSYYLSNLWYNSQ
jgi:hypothetical protein